MADFKAGDRVKWNSHGGEAHGKVVRKLTGETEVGGRVGGHRDKASADDPQYLVETDEGKQAAHKPGALSKG